ncbi:MAG: hypothetical protein ACI4NI_06615, partial [Candidatus Ornithospirochaeta sp.]
MKEKMVSRVLVQIKFSKKWTKSLLRQNSNMRYKVIVSRKPTEMLINHIRFLSFVSVPASKALRDEFSSVLNKLKENPLQFQIEE